MEKFALRRWSLFFIYLLSYLLPLGGSIEYELYYLPSELNTIFIHIYKAGHHIVSIIYAVFLTRPC